MTQPTTPTVTDRQFRFVIAGLGITTFTTLLLELTLTRVYSAVLWYHFAFMSISLALFGMSAGGILHFLFPQAVEGKDFHKRLGIYNALFGITTFLLLVVLLQVRWILKVNLSGMFQLLLLYVLSSVPFFLSGLSTSIVLKRYSEKVNLLYFVDLFGAAFGCIFLIPLLEGVGGLHTIVILSMLAAAGGLSYAIAGETKPGMTIAGGAAGLLAVLFVVNMAAPFLDIRYIKGHDKRDFFETEPIFEAWNSFSLVSVFHYTDEGYRGYSLEPLKETEQGRKILKERNYLSWGKSDRYQGEYPQQLNLIIDGGAGTAINRWDGNPESVPHLDYEITSVGYFLKQDQDFHTLIIGPGGGNDIMSALYYGAEEITAVELNPLIYKITSEVVADFTADLVNRPEVDYYIDEGRSFIRRSTEEYDVIQASLIDTWAATAAGAYTLSENTLYTVEAFEDYLDHLRPNGIVTMARFIFDPPRQSLRAASLAVEALLRRGVERPQEHIIVVKGGNSSNLLVKKSPFTEQEVRQFEARINEVGFETLFSPLSPNDEYFTRLIAGPDRQQFVDEYFFDITPSTDDRPFFFNMVRPRDWFKVFTFQSLVDQQKVQAGQNFNYDAVFILFTLLFGSGGLVVAFILLPVAIKSKSMAKEGSGFMWKMVAYFSSLGLGFMLVEIAMLQKFILFLGHPTYALAVILFSILLSSSFGSRYAQNFPNDGLHLTVSKMIGVILAVSCVYLVVLPFAFDAFIGWPTMVKIPFTVVLLFPLGFFMGMPFPTGLRILRSYSNDYLPWAFGINGATSVFGSIIAFSVAMSIGYTMTLVVGLVIYGMGMIALRGLPLKGASNGPE